MFVRALFALALLVPLPALADALPPGLQAALDAPLRADKNRARDGFRHPGPVLGFFGVKPDSVVVEIDPGASGYWTEILAPFLKDRGRYIAALPEPTSEEAKRDDKGFADKIAADPAAYGRVETSQFAADRDAIAAPGSADVVLTFRNLHNWMAKGEAPAALKAFFAALKPGGVLGIVDHRGLDSAPQDPLAKSGYVRQDYAIQLIEAAGFKFAGASEANANPRDTKDYPVGVWALPPTYRLKEVDRAKYQAIGESDRFTLKFVKP
ncbi:MAG: class I SAM-dependent methyltransferase [Pseudomonadota bacterium]|nr:class I SAM-dependent methyltransferase [Pseudomonadota bacterium]